MAIQTSGSARVVDSKLKQESNQNTVQLSSHIFMHYKFSIMYTIQLSTGYLSSNTSQHNVFESSHNAFRCSDCAVSSCGKQMLQVTTSFFARALFKELVFFLFKEHLPCQFGWCGAVASFMKQAAVYRENQQVIFCIQSCFWQIAATISTIT